MNKCFMIKVYDGDKVLYLEDTDMLNFTADKEEAYVFDNHSDALSFMDELKRNYKDYRFSILILDVEGE